MNKHLENQSNEKISNKSVSDFLSKTGVSSEAAGTNMKTFLNIAIDDEDYKKACVTLEKTIRKTKKELLRQKRKAMIKKIGQTLKNLIIVLLVFTIVAAAGACLDRDRLPIEQMFAIQAGCVVLGVLLVKHWNDEED